MAIDKRRKRGRPPKYDSKHVQLKVLLSDSEKELLEMASEKYGISQSDIVREGIKSRINLLSVADLSEL